MQLGQDWLAAIDLSIVLRCGEVNADVFHGRKGYPKALPYSYAIYGKNILCKLIQFVSYNIYAYTVGLHYIFLLHALWLIYF